MAHGGGFLDFRASLRVDAPEAFSSLTEEAQACMAMLLHHGKCFLTQFPRRC